MIYELAGLRVNVKNRCRYTSEFCKEYLSEDQDSSADFEAETTKEEFYVEKEASPGFSDGYIENICLYRKICLQMPEYDRFLLHSAVLTFEGNAYAFLGRSGIGKSTHTALYTAHIKGSEILNGDKPIIARTGDEFIAYGTPWSGKEKRFYCPRNGERRKKRWNLPTVSLRTYPRTYCIAIWKRKRRKRRFPL